jgi:NAD(P)H-dependent FMN reductase
MPSPWHGYALDFNICSTRTVVAMTTPTGEQSRYLESGSAAAHADVPGTLTFAVIAASVRKQRLSRVLAEWIAGLVPGEKAGVDLIDLAEHPLPDDELLQPGGGPRSEIADRVAAADGFVIVTPEYNHSYPASLKRAIDWHYAEWKFKPATVITYGVQGGLPAAEHLRGVFAELSVVTTRRAVGIRAPWSAITEDGYAPEAGLPEAVQVALGELAWWAETLRQARRDRPYQG